MSSFEIDTYVEDRVAAIVDYIVYVIDWVESTYKSIYEAYHEPPIDKPNNAIEEIEMQVIF